MRRNGYAATMLLLLMTSVAHAAGVNVRWNDCYGDGGVVNRMFACNANTGANIMVVSFVLDATVPQVQGTEIKIDIASATPTLPAWWQFKNAGSCRLSSLSVNTLVNPADIVCVDWGEGQSVGALGSYAVGVLGPNTARILALTAVPAPAVSDLAPGTEYFTCNVLINNQKTVGTGACGGCSTPVCIAVTSLQVDALNPADNVLLTAPAFLPNSNYVTWQQGFAPPPACASDDSTGFAVTSTVVGRGVVNYSRVRAQYPPGSPITLTAVPLPGDRFVNWSGDTTTTEPTLDIVVTRPLSYVAHFEKDPASAPTLLGVKDYPGDQGGDVLVHWQRSPLDGVTATGLLQYYMIQRQLVSPPGAPWIDNQSYTAVQAPEYELAGTTLADSTAADPALYRWRVVGHADTLTWTSNELTGYSVDNIAPPAPDYVSGTIASGVATMFWPAVSAPGLDHYAIYRSVEPSPPIDAAHRVGTTTATGFSDTPGHYANYAVTAVDVHGNEGQATAFVPSNPSGVGDRETPHVLTVGSPTPSPMSRRMSMSIGLPIAMSVTAEVLDTQGRLVRRLAEGEQPAGWLDLRWDARDADGRDSAAGVYFIRVHTSQGDRFKRLVLLP